MERRFRIRIDVTKLRAHLSKEEGRELPDDEVFRWLAEAGFLQQGDAWLVSERDLGQLDPSEVTEAEVVDEA